MKTILNILACLASLCVVSSADAQWSSFYIVNNSSGISYTQSLYSGPWTSDPVIGTTTRPAGTTTQWMSFYMYSNNFFARNRVALFPGDQVDSDHVAFLLRGHIGPTDHPAAGIVVGNVAYQQAGQGCYCQLQERCQVPPNPLFPAPSVEVEDFSPNGALYPSTCNSTLTLRDGRWYKVDMHAHDNGSVTYWITDTTTSTTEARGVQTAFNTATGGTDFAVAGVRGGANAFPWTMQIWGLATGWF